MKYYISAALAFLSFTFSVDGKENINVLRTAPPPQTPTIFAGCEPSTSRADLDVNNVRTPIWINGDMWWDLVSNALYEIPVGSGKNSLYAGAIWIGGKDAGGQLKVAAQTYRQSGSDFWPGPIDTANTTITPDICQKYDKHFKITLAEVRNFHEEYQVGGNASYPIPDIIKDWPANDFELNHAPILAPFHDENGDGTYDINDNDYPKYYLPGSTDNPCDKNLLLGDQTIWWVFNDVGNIHSETQSVSPVGIEIQAQAFGFNTNDEINNMTFYRYKIINRNTTVLNETYFGAWVDPDLGNYLDDYVGCDVGRGLGFCYNGDADDDGALGYGLNPPAVGVDFFEGPLADIDSIDNDRDGEIDEVGEQLIMSKFVYYNNDATTIGNPNNAAQYYGYLDGVWKDNTLLRYGGDGHQNTTGILCNFMFPGESDPLNIGTGGVDPGFEWSETQPTPAGTPNPPSDRRFLQSAGKFTLQPGAVNYITTGVVWARTSSGGPSASVKILKIADVKAQNLFEACFKVVDGPDAPVLSIRELDKEVLISLINPNNSNNYKEKYTEKDANIPRNPNAVFTFEGYKVYQVADPSVTVTDLLDPDKARLVFQTDIQNGLSQIVNKTLNGDLSAYVPVEQVLGADKGLRHSFRLTNDAFATGNPTFVNHKTYYYIAVAYAYDSVADILDPFVTPTPDLYGQPYIQSRKSSDGSAIRVYTAIPHDIAPEGNGLILGSSFGDGPEIQRITGLGNGHIIGSERPTLDIKQSQIDEIIFNQSNPSNRIQFPIYERARGPVDIRIYDPVKVPPHEFELWMNDTITNRSFTGIVRGDTNVIMNVPYSSLVDLASGLAVSSISPFFPSNAFITGYVETSPGVYTINLSQKTRGTRDDVDSAAFVSAGASWFLKDLVTGRIDTSVKTTEFAYDQIFTEENFPIYGFYVSLNQVKAPGESPTGGNGALPSTYEFSSGNQTNGWLTGIPDIDNFRNLNWILAGNNTDAAQFTPTDRDGDGSGFYEKLINGTWAPFYFASQGAGFTNDFVEPAPSFGSYGSPSGTAMELDSLRFLSNVDVVITSDKSKWSRCVVFEEGKLQTLNQGSQLKCLIRKHKSLDINGNEVADDPGSALDSGFSYFPGYAINQETGERLNIAFGEDSHLPGDNGADMKWNPTSSLLYTLDGENVTLFAGGKHYIYVFGNKGLEKHPSDTNFYGPAYDGCQSIHERLWGVTASQMTNGFVNRRVTKSWKDCMWVGVPLLNPGQTLLATDVKVRLRVAKPYRQFDSGNGPSFNNNYPYYRFGTSDLTSKVNQLEVAKSAMDLIRAVPNPYYAYSNYESNQLDNRIKIVNLPPKCVVSIYTTSGTLIRRLSRDAGSNVGYNNSEGSDYPNVNLESSVDWDLKNALSVPVASGMYLIHVQADGVGEKTIKWFGVMRPIDLDTF